MPVKLCTEPGCGNTATRRSRDDMGTRCQEHATTRNRDSHNPERKRIYGSNRWRYLRRAVLIQQPLCECGDLAVDVHHIRDLAQGGAPYDPANCLALCKACHGVLTRREQIGSTR